MDTQRENTTPRSALARGLILACVLVGIYAFGPASAAHAGTYVARECNIAGGPTGAPDAVYHGELAGGSYSGDNSCSVAGGGLSVWGNPGAGGQYLQEGRWQLMAPAGTLIRALNFNYRAWNSCGTTGYVDARDAWGGVQLAGFGPSAPDILNCGVGHSACADSGCDVSNNGNLMSAKTINAVAYCGGTGSFQGCIPAEPWTGGFVVIRDLKVTLEDLQRPNPPGLAGSLVEGGPRRGSESLVVNASDVGSGVRSIDVYVNGGNVGHSEIACDEISPGVARRFTPCPTSTSDTFSAPTEAGPWREGANTLEVCAVDYGGLDRCTSTTVSVDNSCDDSTGTTVGSTLEAGLAKGDEKPRVTTVVSSKDSIQIKGSLSTPGGAPVQGANVCIYEQTSGVREDRAIADIVHTKANGTFLSRIDPGPSREVYVDYRHSNLVLEKHLNLGATSSPVLKIRKKHVRNGKSMRFKGSIPGPYSAGRIVTMQARVGKKWKTFLQATTDTAGRYKGRYRFKNSTVARAKYRFRAVVKEQAGYPYKTGTSKPAKVIVKG